VYTIFLGHSVHVANTAEGNQILKQEGRTYKLRVTPQTITTFTSNSLVQMGWKTRPECIGRKWKNKKM